MMIWFTDSVFMRGKETRQKKDKRRKKIRKTRKFFRYCVLKN